MRGRARPRLRVGGCLTPRWACPVSSRKVPWRAHHADSAAVRRGSSCARCIGGSIAWCTAAELSTTRVTARTVVWTRVSSVKTYSTPANSSPARRWSNRRPLKGPASPGSKGDLAGHGITPRRVRRRRHALSHSRSHPGRPSRQVQPMRYAFIICGTVTKAAMAQLPLLARALPHRRDRAVRPGDRRVRRIEPGGPPGRTGLTVIEIEGCRTETETQLHGQSGCKDRDPGAPGDLHDADHHHHRRGGACCLVHR